MKKRVKVFEAGDYPQLPFSKDDVTNAFGKIKKGIEGIFIHSSKWKSEGKEPIGIGEFSNFSIDNGIAYADLELNDKGIVYNQDGLFKGISAEFNKTTKELLKIALLPIGINPAVKGAEFAEFESTILEFEEFTNELIEETLTEIITEVEEEEKEVKLKVSEIIAGMKGLNKEELESIKAEFQSIEFSLLPVKTEEEIRAEVKAEYEAEKQVDKDLAEFEAVLVKKVLPLHQEAYRMAYKASQGKTDTVEFEEKQVTQSEMIKSKVTKMADINLTAEFAEGQEKPVEFSESEKRLNEINKTSQEISKIYGGKQ